MPERLRLLLLAVLLLAGVPARAFQPGETLPPLRVERAGELQIEGDAARFAAWDSARLLGGPVQVVQYMAARLSARDINRPFTDRLEKSGIPFERYHVTTIVNVDDAMFGTRGMVMSELEKNKRRYHLSTIVADEEGRGLEAWRLQGRSSAIFILSPEGRVLFFRDGAMSPAEIEQALELVRSGGTGAS